MSVSDDQHHIQGLDALRAFAAIAVVAFHTRLPGFSGGFLGVDVFFVVSGYLTASIALSGRQSFMEFMQRRLLRLWPLMIVATIAIAVFWAALTGEMPRGLVAGALFFLDLEMTDTGPHGPMTHFWTLGIEMKFYLLVACMAAMLRPQLFLLTMLLAFCAVTVARVVHSDQWLIGFYGFAFHSSGLFLGAAAAVIPRVHASRTTLWAGLIVLGLALKLAVFQSPSALWFWITSVEIATCLVILQFVSLPRMPALDTPNIRLMGTLSFGVYVWHYPIALVTRDSFAPSLAFVITLAVATCLAVVSYRLVEQPFLRMGKQRKTAPKSRPFQLSYSSRTKLPPLWTANAPAPIPFQSWQRSKKTKTTR